MRKTTKKIISFAAAFAIMAAANTPAISNMIPSLNGTASVTVNAAESVKEFSYSNFYGTWDLKGYFGTMGSDGYYKNVKLTLTGFTPKNSGISNVSIPSLINHTPNVKGINYKLSDAKITVIGERALQDHDFKTINIPSSVNVISSYAFTGCDNLEKVVFESGSQLEKINMGAFYNCTELYSINLPDRLNFIDDFVFGYCASLENITIPGNVSSIPKHCFDSSAVKNINCNTNAISDMTGMMYSCKNLTTINKKHFITSERITSSFKDVFLKQSHYANIGFNKAFDRLMDEEITKIVNETTKNCKNDYQKASALYDWVCNKVKYDPTDTLNSLHNTEKARTNHCDYSIFLNDISVCDGISTGYHLLLDKAGIENYYAFNEDHIWIVAKFNGLFYHLDCSADLQFNTNRKYFMFLDSPIPDSFYNPDNHKTTAVKPSNGPSDYNYVRNLGLLCNSFLGDANHDGVITSADFDLLNTYVLTNNRRALNDINSNALDLNGDGKIDFGDTSFMNLYMYYYVDSFKYIEQYYLTKKI